MSILTSGLLRENLLIALIFPPERIIRIWGSNNEKKTIDMCIIRAELTPIICSSKQVINSKWISSYKMMRWPFPYCSSNVLFNREEKGSISTSTCFFSCSHWKKCVGWGGRKESWPDSFMRWHGSFSVCCSIIHQSVVMNKGQNIPSLYLVLFQSYIMFV